MAVNINIPGVGTVSADNAATESTLQSLLQAVSTSAGQQRRQASNAANDLNATARGAQATSVAMGMVAGKTRNVSAEMAVFSQALNKDVASAGGRLSYVFSDVTRLMGTFALTLATATTAYATNYKEIAKNPIGAAMNTTAGAIDLLTRSAETGGGMMKKFGFLAMATFTPMGLLGGALGVVAGTLLETLGPALGAVAQQLNTTFGKELEQTVSNFRTLSASGAIFAGGMTEMRNAAHSSGTTMDVFTNGIKLAGDSVRNLGYSYSGGMGLISEVSHHFGSTVGTSGQTLQREMLNLGYGLEDQIALSAEYMSSQRAGMTTDRMRAMTSKELAIGTAQYAEDLTVLRTLTKEDAKAASERARAASMEADIMAQLDPEAGQRFQGVMRTMPEALRKGFMEQLSLGTVVDAASNIFLSQNEAARAGFAEAEQIVRNTSMTMGEAQVRTADITASIATEQRRLSRDGQVAINQAARVGIGGAIGEVASMINGIISGTLYDEGTAELAKTSAEKARATTDELTTTTNNIIANSNAFGQEMEALVTNFLPKYSSTLDLVNDTMFKFTKFVLGAIPGVDINENRGGYLQDATTDITKPRSALDKPRSASPAQPLESWGGAAQIREKIYDNNPDANKNSASAAESAPKEYIIPGLVSTLEAVKTSVEKLASTVADNEEQNRVVWNTIATNGALNGERLTKIAANGAEGVDYQRKIAFGTS